MLALSIHVAATVHRYLALYMPTNRLIEWLRTPLGLKWAVPVALVTVPVYLFATSVCATVVDRGGPGYSNMLVLLFAWNAIKLAVTGAVSLPMLLWRRVASVRRSS